MPVEMKVIVSEVGPEGQMEIKIDLPPQHCTAREKVSCEAIRSGLAALALQFTAEYFEKQQSHN